MSLSSKRDKKNGSHVQSDDENENNPTCLLMTGSIIFLCALGLIVGLGTGLGSTATSPSNSTTADKDNATQVPQRSESNTIQPPPKTTTMTRRLSFFNSTTASHSRSLTASPQY